MVSRLERAITTARQSALNNDVASLARLYVAYMDALGRISPLAARLAVDPSTDGPTGRRDLLASTAWATLLRVIELELASLASLARAIVAVRRREAIQSVPETTRTMVLASVKTARARELVRGQYITVPTGDSSAEIPTMSGETVDDWVARFADVIVAIATAKVIDAITKKESIADAVMKSMDIGRNRAMAFVRTEPINAARTATIEQYKANTETVKGWRFWANPNACVELCVPRHGEFYPLEVPFDSHPNCACWPVPALSTDDQDGWEHGISGAGNEKLWVDPDWTKAFKEKTAR